MNCAEAIGARIVALRKRQGLTQKVLAEHTGMCRVNLARLERGRHTPSLALIVRVARALGVKPTTILRSIDDPKLAPPPPSARKRTPRRICELGACTRAAVHNSPWCPEHQALTVDERAAIPRRHA